MPAVFGCPSFRQAKAGIDRFRVLCTNNLGCGETLQINHLCEKTLRSKEKGGIERPIFKMLLVARRNDYRRLLFNSDSGVVIENPGLMRNNSVPGISGYLICSNVNPGVPLPSIKAWNRNLTQC